MDREKRARKQLEDLTARYPALAPIKESIWEAYQILKEAYDRGGKLMVCGNGGSCADSEHIVGELMKGFCKRRRIPEQLRERLLEVDETDGALLSENLEQALPAIALTSATGLNTAFANDRHPDLIFAQQVLGYGRPGDVLLGITTSGNSRNVLYAMELAEAQEIRTIALTGRDGGRAGKRADCAIIVPAEETYRIQEYHLPVYHTLCLMLEDTYFSE